MEVQTIEDMKKLGASLEEATAAIELFELLHPALKVKRNGRIGIRGGDKTVLGFYRTMKRTMLSGVSN